MVHQVEIDNVLHFILWLRSLRNQAAIPSEIPTGLYQVTTHGPWNLRKLFFFPLLSGETRYWLRLTLPLFIKRREYDIPVHLQTWFHVHPADHLSNFKPNHLSKVAVYFYFWNVPKETTSPGGLPVLAWLSIFWQGAQPLASARDGQHILQRIGKWKTSSCHIGIPLFPVIYKSPRLISIPLLHLLRHFKEAS